MMEGNILIFLAALLPMFAAPLAYALGRKQPRRAILTMTAVSAFVLVGLLYLLVSAANQNGYAFAWDGFCGFGIQMKADGFRGLYACVAGFMWLITSLFSLDYFKHEENVGRYAFFTLLTFGATVGLFLSDTLYTAFVFFEIMSLSSYPWVAHEETPAALRAAQTYLYIALIGGLTTLMGLFLLPNQMAILPMGQLSAVASNAGFATLWFPSLLILVGFGAKLSLIHI